MENNQMNTSNPKIDLDFRRKQNAEEMRHQVISFALMILFTIIAFVAVGAGFSAWFTVPFILVLAAVQVAFQLFYFMHMNHKGHEAPMLFMFSGVFFAIVMIIAYLTIIWW
ncbi:cytochrome c oxidase subunit IVB [Robertmurraya andreesenii]|uniref:Cytochrome c oxidase subunit 4 n=1 Tax=Anoxybacillus andreesenii TaxID=1325932 RepID=A0ABT9V4L6_9BACL|nr:cytochrome c oxidase subunit IVB [Robertmurraya andreesenii]MDQ0155879.1 cytochrome c oxidase subunit 4 [Robertmurraya andreesenii]